MLIGRLSIVLRVLLCEKLCLLWFIWRKMNDKSFEVRIGAFVSPLVISCHNFFVFWLLANCFLLYFMCT
jgi:hypothetical protein